MKINQTKIARMNILMIEEFLFFEKNSKIDKIDKIKNVIR